jgi:PhoH-like ATPase
MTEKTKKTYVLDTNVLMSDAGSLYAFDDNEVVLPLIVLEELDRHKDRQDDAGKEVREVSRRLKKILADLGDPSLLKDGIPLDNKGRLFMMSAEDATDLSNFQAESSALPEELDPKKGDNQILHFCLAFKSRRPDLILVTRDVLLSVKAKALGIPCQTYKRMQVAANADQLYSGSTSIEADIDFAKAYAGDLEFGEISQHLEALPEPNEFISVKGITDNRSVLLRYTGNPSMGSFKIVNNDTVDKLQMKNKEQKYAVNLLLDPNVKLVTLVGGAGTGKTLLSIAAGLEQTIGNKSSLYKSLVISRPVQPMGGKSNDIGFLPGTLEEKMEPWVAPIKDNLRFLFSQGKKSKQTEDTLDIMFERGIIEVEALMYIRGRSIANAYMIIDEAQNLTAHELKTIITRVGDGTKIVFTGDIEQIDNLGVDSTSNGLAIAVEKFKSSKIAGHVTLFKGERSELATLAATLL